MEMLSNAVLSELVSRSMSFLLAKCTSSTAEDDLLRLRQLLLRCATVIEEAGQRHITDRAMLQQLKALQDETFRGHYVLDAVTCRAPQGEQDGSEDDEEEVLGRRAFALSRFNTAKRLRFPASRDLEPNARAFAGNLRELPSVVRSLEGMLGDMKEFVVFLTSYPPLHRQPYSAHLSVGKCMFSLQMERETVMEFLLQPTPPGARNQGVLPILGPPHIGKSTLVENVCADEKVRNHFSLILFYNGNELKDETMASLRDNCVIKHRNGEASGERLLIVIELLDDYNVDDETWDKLTGSFSQTSVPQGTKIIITSRCENIARLGMTKALELRCLTAEAYWYLFKMMVFGSDDPGQHPKMESLALEMAHQMHGSYLFAYLGAVLLRANFNTKSWARILSRLRQYVQRNGYSSGEYPDDFKAAKEQPRYTYSLLKEKPDAHFMIYNLYQKSSVEEKAVPEITFVDLLAGHPQPRGRYEILFWKSQIPPYYSYMSTCDIRDM